MVYYACNQGGAGVD